MTAAPDPTAGERGIEFPAHHIVGLDLGFTCTNCGGHTSLTPPCIPARTYALTPASPPAVAASTGRSENVEALAEAEREQLSVALYGRGRPDWMVAGPVMEAVGRIVAAREAAARAEAWEAAAELADTQIVLWSEVPGLHPTAPEPHPAAIAASGARRTLVVLRSRMSEAFDDHAARIAREG